MNAKTLGVLNECVANKLLYHVYVVLLLTLMVLAGTRITGQAMLKLFTY